MNADRSTFGSVLERRIFWGTLTLLCGLYLCPLWSARFIPVLDMPVHLEMASIIHNLDDPAFDFARHFELRGALVPYWTYYGSVHLLSYLMPIEVANKAVLSLVNLGLVAAMLVALRAFRRSPWLVFLAMPLMYDVNSTYGYVSFRLSVILALSCVGLLRRELDLPRLWRQLTLIGLSALTYFTHAHGFAVMMVLALFVLVMSGARRLVTARAALTLLPAAVLAAPWYFGALFGGGPGGPVHTPTLPLIRLMELVPHRALNSFTDGRDEFVAIGMSLVWVGLAAAPARACVGGLRARLADHLPMVLAGVMLVAYFAAPNQILTPTTKIYGINYRFLLVIGLLAVLVPRVDLRGLRALWITPAVAFAAYFGSVVLEEYRTFDRWYRGFDRIIQAAAPGRRVMPFTYTTRAKRFTVPMLGHFVGYLVAHRGGVPSNRHTFATYRYMPVKLKKPLAHPEPNYNGQVSWRVFGARYDYFLIIDRPGSSRLPFDDTRHLRLRARSGPFRLYEKK